MTSAAVFRILHALESCGALDLVANREKNKYQAGQGHQSGKAASFLAIGLDKGNGNKSVQAKGKEEEQGNLLAEIKGTKGTDLLPLW
jgi:hypothetical protein